MPASLLFKHEIESYNTRSAVVGEFFAFNRLSSLRCLSRSFLNCVTEARGGAPGILRDAPFRGGSRGVARTRKFSRVSASRNVAFDRSIANTHLHTHARGHRSYLLPLSCRECEYFIFIDAQFFASVYI